jgi:hypothetical protein
VPSGGYASKAPKSQHCKWREFLDRSRSRGGDPPHALHAGKQSGEDVAKGLSHLILVLSVTGELRRRLEHKIALYKAASEVRYIAIFNNGSPTEPNGVSELGLAPHRATVLTTKRSPAEVARKKSQGWG